MKITRRKFLKMSGALTGYLLTGPSLWGGGGLPEAYANMGPKVGSETTTICCFCGCGCGAVVTTSSGTVVAVEGDVAHPVNQGTLCSKGQAMYQTVNQLLTPAQLATSKYQYYDGLGAGEMGSWPKGKRLARVLYRPPNGKKWEVHSWGWALAQIANRIMTTRAAGFTQSADDGAGTMTVNRCDNIAALGGAAHDNEECYLMRKLWTGLGLVNIDHQARI